MEQLLVFNGVKVLLTTGQDLREVQSFMDEDPDIILSINPGDLRLLANKSVLHVVLDCTTTSLEPELDN